MKRLLFIFSVLSIAASVSYAQSGIRIFGAQQLQLDDNVFADPRVFLTTINGSLGVDITGNGVAGIFPSPCALGDFSSTIKGFLIPRMSTAQQNAICGGAPTEGLLVYNLSTHSFDIYTGAGGWAQAWTTRGNLGLNPALDYLGTGDAVDLVFRTNAIERARIVSSGDVGINNSTPTSRLDVVEGGVQPTITSTANGTGIAGSFRNTNATNGSNVIQTVTNGTGNSIFAQQNGPIGSAGFFQMTNAANPSPTIWSLTNSFNGAAVFGNQIGLGDCGSFQITNAASGANAMYILTIGTGPAIQVRAVNTGILFGNSPTTGINLQGTTTGINFANSPTTGILLQGTTTGINFGNSPTTGIALRGTTTGINFLNAPTTGTNLQAITTGINFANSPTTGIALQGTTTGINFANSPTTGILLQGTTTGINFGNSPTTGILLQGTTTGINFGNSPTTGIALQGTTTGINFANAPTTGINLQATTTGILINSPLSISANGSIQTTGNNNIFGNNSVTDNVFIVNGQADATNLNVAADPVWDSRINGDQLVTGMQKIGGSIWMDGNSNPHQIVTDADVQFGTRTENSLSLITTGTSRMTLDAGGNVTFNVNNSNYNVGGGAFNVSASPSNGAQYAANITTTGHAGLSIKCTEQGGTGLNSTTHFADFYDGTQSGYRGSIQGEDYTEYFADPVNAANLANEIADGVCTAAEIIGAAASAATVIGIPEGVVFTAQAVDLGVHIGGYTAVTLEQTTNLLGVAYTSSSGDYAEYLKRANVDEHYYPGDIVGVKNGLISKNTENADNVMSISLAPIVLGNVPEQGHEKEYNKVGFLGQVPVKVIGAVNAGDFIVPSGRNDGIGKAVPADEITPDEFTMVVGRSWTSSAFMGLHYVKVAVGLNAKAMSEIVAKQQHQIDELKAQVDEMQTLKARLSRVEQYLGSENTVKSVNVRSN
ncbi:MAG TPA: hypothetical protein VEW28_07680 [Candidatus Kapabacteria bacterium]|nr:hypothetical protein [Candidatus Kapabacteria bacterium]